MIISKNIETELLRNKKADEFVVCLKFHVYALLYTCLLAFVLIFLGSLNAYMIIPRLGHQSIFLNGIMYVFIIFTAFVCFKNIQEYKEERDEKLNLIYGLYVLPIINSEAYKNSVTMCNVFRLVLKP